MVGTPIGNLEDITLRALRILASVDVIAAEDTRLTRRLLARHQVATRLVSCHEHSSPAALRSLVARLTHSDVALVTDAGTPGVSDPGATLVAAAVAAGHSVVPVPGPSAVSAAVSVSALDCTVYTFCGFLPRRSSARRALLARFGHSTLVAFEAPTRLIPSLEDCLEVLGDRPVCVARELTKVHEELWRGQLSAALAHWRQTPPRGEFTLVIAAASDAPLEPWSDAQVRAALTTLKAEGLGPRDAARQLAGEASRPAREIYRLWEHDHD